MEQEERQVEDEEEEAEDLFREINRSNEENAFNHMITRSQLKL